MSVPTCGWCSEPSEFLCDTVLLPAGAVAGRAFETVEEAETCDAEMCPAHATVQLRGHTSLDLLEDASCGVATASGSPCSRITGGDACWQHTGRARVEPEPRGFENHCCPYCAASVDAMCRTVPADVHRIDARAHGGRSQMRAL